MMNVFEDIPYPSERMGRREVVYEKDLLLMQIALQPGQALPPHKANSNVHLLLLEGELEADLAGDRHRLKTGDLLPVAVETPMRIRNDGTRNATFLVLKAPHPSEMK